MLKKLVRKAHLPLSQVARRIYERVDMKPDTHAAINECLKPHSDGPLHSSLLASCHQYRAIRLHNCYIKCYEGDNCVKIEIVVPCDGNNSVRTESKIVLVRNIAKSDITVFLLFEEFLETDCFFSYPQDSSELGIYLVKGLSGVKCIELNSRVTLQKYVMLPHGDKYVALPLIHT